MDKVLTPIVTSVSEFRSDMPGTLRRAKREPFAVLSNNKPSFYVLSPEHYELITELLFDLDIAGLVEARMKSAEQNSVSVDINEL